MKKRLILIGLALFFLVSIFLISNASAILTSFTLTAQPNEHYFIRLLDYNTNESLTDFEITLNDQGYGSNYFNLEPKKLTVKLMLIENGRVSQTTFLNKEDYTAGKPIVIIMGAGSGAVNTNTAILAVNNTQSETNKETNETSIEKETNTTETIENNTTEANIPETNVQLTSEVSQTPESQVQDNQVTGDVAKNNDILNESKSAILKNKYYFIIGIIVLIVIVFAIVLYKKKLSNSDWIHEFSTGKKHRNLKLLKAQNKLKKDKMELKMLKKAPRIEEIRRNMIREKEELRKLRGQR
ncbi:MAG: hypothetical protein WC796_03560 [Candidatus Pacearchaeota archaeon]|jgi:hypothetical protein